MQHIFVCRNVESLHFFAEYLWNFWTTHTVGGEEPDSRGDILLLQLVILLLQFLIILLKFLILLLQHLLLKLKLLKIIL